MAQLGTHELRPRAVSWPEFWEDVFQARPTVKRAPLPARGRRPVTQAELFVTTTPRAESVVTN